MPDPDTQHIAVCGISHRTCPVEIRDLFGFPEEDVPKAVQKILEVPGIREAVLVSTCNRTEIYVSGEDLSASALFSCWAALCGAPAGHLDEYGYFHRGVPAVTHLFRVSSSLDSLVLGEGQILGQVRDAYRQAAACGGAGAVLHQLFQRALRTGKKVRQDTRIAEGAVSVAFAAVDLCQRSLGDLRGRRAGILGAGEMGGLVVSHLSSAGVRDFLFFNRSKAPAEELAAHYGGKAYGIDCLASEFASLDILISCTAAPGFILFADHVRPYLADDGKTKVIVDIAAPRDVHPDVGLLPGIRLLSMDDLEEVVGNNRRARSVEAEKAARIVEDAVDDFLEWNRSLDAVPVLREVEDHIRRMVALEVEARTRGLDPEQKARMELLGHAIAGKILHIPVTELRRMSAEGMGVHAAHWARVLFLGSEDVR